MLIGPLVICISIAINTPLTSLSSIPYPKFFLQFSHTYILRNALCYFNCIKISSFCRMATVGDIRESQGSENSIDVENLARFAVEDHNKKQNTLLEYQKVLKTKEQVVTGTMYYITVEVKDGDKKKVYEAKVWVKPWLNFKQVEEFKLIGDAESSSVCFSTK